MRTSAFLPCALALLAASGASPQEDEKAAKERQARQALEWLEDADPELQEVGRQALRRMGTEAVPFIEARLAEKGAAELVRVLREVEGAGAADGRAPRLEDLSPPQEPPKGVPKGDRAAAERYVQSKYAEAYHLAQKKLYQRAYDLAGAILVLEPRSESSESVRKLRRYCDNMIMQTSLMEARVVQPRAAYVAGERIDLTLRLRNLHRSAVNIRYDSAPLDKPQGGKTIIQIEVRVPQERGDVTTFTASDMVIMDKEIPIALGAQWERVFTLDTTLPGQHAEHFQVLVVHAWTIPDKIESEGVPVTRRIQFEPAVLKILPVKYAKYLEDPLGSLRKAMDDPKSAPRDVFVAALLLDGEAKEKGVSLLVESMKGAERAQGRVWLGHLLSFMTDQKLGDDWRKWEEWLKSRPGKKE
jgi:hypothetical protein